MDYTPLFSFLEHGVGEGGLHVLRDSWWIYTKTELNISKTCDDIRKLMAEKDHFYLTKLSESDINGWLPSTSWNWFSDKNK